MYRILLVDDEILVREAISENIDWKAMDCELAGVCENGQQAAEFVRTHAVDIVLTDILMPYMDGMELSHFLYDNFPEIVVAIFSGFSDFEYAKQAMQYHVSEYMLKPITSMELREVIERLKEKVDKQKHEKARLDHLTKTETNYKKNALLIRSRAVDALVNCTKDIKESIADLENMGIVLNAFYYRVAVLDIDIYSELYHIDMEKRQESALMAFVLFNIADEIMKQNDAGIAYQEGNNRVSILFMGEKNQEFTSRTAELCREIQLKTKEAMGLDISVGIGQWVRVPQELPESHRLAVKAMEYRYLLGGHILIDTEEETLDQNISIYESLRTMTTAMKTGNKEKTDLALAKMEQEIKASMVQKSRACLYLQQIIRETGICLETIAADQEQALRQREELVRQVTEQKTFQMAIALVKEYVQKTFTELSEVNSSSGQRQAALGLDYIQSHYMDPELSLNGICSYLNISTSHFSTIFKEMAGETFIEALTRIRMEKACELLETTALKNYEIAEKVGFSDPHYFGIAFKKMTGKTPTKYAREKRK